MGKNRKEKRKLVRELAKRNTGNSTKSLKEIKRLFEVPPELPPIDPTLDPREYKKQLEADAKEKRTCAAKVLEDAQIASAIMQDHDDMSLEALEVLDEDSRLTSAMNFLVNAKKHPVPAYRRAVRIGVLFFEFGQELENREEVDQLLSNLCRDDILAEASEGFLKNTFTMRIYTLPGNLLFRFRPEKDIELANQLKDVATSLHNLIGRVKTAHSKAVQEKILNLQSGPSLSVPSLLKGEPGPWRPMMHDRHNDRNGGHVLLGGVLHCESDGKAVFPIDSGGHFDFSEVKINGKRIGITIASLETQKPRFTEFLEDADHLRKMYSVWNFISRAINDAKEQAELDPIREEFASQATSTPEEWLLDHKEGIAHLAYTGSWHVRNGGYNVIGVINHLFFNAERVVEEDKSRVIIHIPKHLVDFLGHCCAGEGYVEEGERFENFPPPIRTVLQAMCTQAQEASNDAKKTAKIKGKR